MQTTQETPSTKETSNKTQAQNNIDLFQRQVAFPEVTRFDELFDEVDKYNDKSIKAREWNMVKVGTYCIIFDNRKNQQNTHKSLAVKVNDKVFQWITSNMLYIIYDTLHFKAIIYDDGSVNIYVEYGQILGSRLLASMDVESIPYV